MKKHISALLWIIKISIVVIGASASVLAQPIVADTCIRPAMPIISGSTHTICRGDSVQLSVGNCTGTVVWSTGQTGVQIGIRPQQTTRYTAICRTQQGCVSCYADVWKVTVQTPDAPVLTLSSGLLCAGDALTITAANCAGTVVWPNGSTGSQRIDYPDVTTTYTAYCQGETCRSNLARSVTVQIAQPPVPTVQVEQNTICLGQTTRLWATGCLGTVRWSDGKLGADRQIQPANAMTYRALCQVGTCVSDSSQPVLVNVQTQTSSLQLLTTLQNECPFQTVNLARALLDAPGGYVPTSTIEFRTGPLFSSAPVQSVGAVTAGTYYIFQHTADGCVRGPVAVQVRIVGCRNGIAPCQSNPASVVIRLDSLDRRAGVVRLSGQLRGSALSAHWQSNGTGLFIDTTLTSARYLASEQDRQRGSVTFALTTPDPDGAGPCLGQTASLSVTTAPDMTIATATIGLSKQALEPVWITNETVSLSYRFTVKNMGQLPIKTVQVADNLEPVLLAAGVQIVNRAVRADSGWVVNPAYTGLGADTTLLVANSCSLPAGYEKHLWLTITANVGRANTLTFDNTAFAQGQTEAGITYRDQSANGTDPDPDHNGDPTDNSNVTTLTVPSATVAEGGSVFIPEGFSPNGDGINDLFVIRGIPAGQTLSLTVYNRWGQAVFQQTPYANEWDGTTNTGGNARSGLPDGTYFYVAHLSDGREYARFLTLSR